MSISLIVHKRRELRSVANGQQAYSDRYNIYVNGDNTARVSFHLMNGLHYFDTQFLVLKLKYFRRFKTILLLMMP